MQKLELISFKLCPFVQRAAIVLKHKNIDFAVTYIDLQNKPDWFLELSPLGRTPVLKVGDEVLFESAVIAEYLDEVTPPSLHPSDPLLKAKNRAWMEFGGELLRKLHGIYGITEPVALEQQLDALRRDLERLERTHGGQTFFNGEQFCLIDAAMAPVFMRLQLLQEITGHELLAGCSKLQRWSHALLALPPVQDSVVAEFPQLFRGMLQKMGGVIAR